MMDSEGARNLAAAVIERAAADLVEARKREDRARTGVKQIQAEADRKECIRFFGGGWYEELCDIVGVDADVVRRGVGI